MISTTIRNPTSDEKREQLKTLPSAYKRFESFMMKLIFVVLILLAPLLTYDHYYLVSSKTQGIYCIIVVLLSIIITNWLTNKYEGGIRIGKRVVNINSTQVEIVRVKTIRAIKREDAEDFGIAFYIDVLQGGQHKTLYLWGQYLDDLEYDMLFPNTEFEFVRQIGSEEFIEFKTIGNHFKEEKTLPAFDKEIWESRKYPLNGELLDKPIDTIV